MKVRCSHRHIHLSPCDWKGRRQKTDTSKAGKWEVIRPNYFTVAIIGRFGTAPGINLLTYNWSLRGGAHIFTFYFIQELDDALKADEVTGCNSGISNWKSTMLSGYFLLLLSVFYFYFPFSLKLDVEFSSWNLGKRMWNFIFPLISVWTLQSLYFY